MCRGIERASVVLQLQTMRTRCEKKKQKDATRRQEELTTEQLAEKQANADACAQVSKHVWCDAVCVKLNLGA